MRGGVDAEISDLDYGFGFVLRWDPAQIGADTGQQFVHAERLGHIVVRPGVERLHFLLLLIANRKNDDGHARNGADGSA